MQIEIGAGMIWQKINGKMLNKVCILMCCLISSYVSSQEEGKYLFLKSKHVGQLYLTVHDDERSLNHKRHSWYAHARRKDTDVTNNVIDCSTWYLEPIGDSHQGYHIWVKSKMLGDLYLAVHPFFDWEKRCPISTYVHARKSDGHLTSKWANCAIWYLEAVIGTNGYHIVSRSSQLGEVYLSVHNHMPSDLRDERSLWVHVRQKDQHIMGNEQDCSIWYLETPDNNRLIFDKLDQLEKRVSDLEETSQSFEDRTRSLDDGW